MKREILFRGKRPNSGKWIEGYLFQKDGFSWILSDRFQSPECSCEVLLETVGQFTGLTDKNGVKEFEHDKVKVSWTTPSTGRYFQSDDAWCEHEAICVIQYVGNRFVYVREDGRQLSIRNDATRKVIGNIHDNPELI